MIYTPGLYKRLKVALPAGIRHGSFSDLFYFKDVLLHQDQTMNHVWRVEAPKRLQVFSRLARHAPRWIANEQQATIIDTSNTMTQS
jgi:hypothetical protein